MSKWQEYCKSRAVVWTDYHQNNSDSVDSVYFIHCCCLPHIQCPKKQAEKEKRDTWNYRNYQIDRLEGFAWYYFYFYVIFSQCHERVDIN